MRWELRPCDGGETALSQDLLVTYYLHSGFSCALGKVLLIFDYWLGEHGELSEQRRITDRTLSRYDEIYVFVSHAHPDHYDPVINDWHDRFPVTYIVSSDMPIGARGKRMAPGDSLAFGEHVTVRAFDSTDLGVSFLVTLDGIHIFHAGDLNFWHWREESTVQEIDEAEQAFHAACEPLAGETIDLAFFPVDPRQGRLFDAGANYFIMTAKPRLLIPMHFWGRSEVAEEFARRARCRATEVIALVRPQERLKLSFAEDGFMTIKPLAYRAFGSDEEETEVALPDEGDVFAETDLPVNLEL